MAAPVFIMRGISGSGKSTVARQLKEAWDSTIAATNDEKVVSLCECRIISADDYFVGKDGVYSFNPNRLKEAHAWAKESFENCLENPHCAIIVDNTNTRRWEYNHYVVAAEAAGRPVKIIRMVADPDVAAARNAHGLTSEMVWKQFNRFEDDPNDILTTGE